MPELDIGIVHRGELNFDQSFLQFNVKRNMQRVFFDLVLNAEYWELLAKAVNLLL